MELLDLVHPTSAIGGSSYPCSFELEISDLIDPKPNVNKLVTYKKGKKY